MAVSRTVELNDLTPEELAELFCGMFSIQQAEFFAAVWEIAKGWPGAGWCQQSCSIVSALNNDGRSAVKALAEHMELADAA